MEINQKSNVNEIEDELPQINEDDIVISNMNVEGMRGYNKHKNKEKQLQQLNVTKKEKWALIKEAYKQILPIVIYFALGMAVVYLLLRLLIFK